MNARQFLLKYRRVLIILAHFFIFLGAYCMAFLLRFDFNIPAEDMVSFYQALPIFVAVQMLSFGFLKQYRGFWLYVSVDDLLELTIANLVALLIIIAAIWVLGWHSFSRAVLLMDFILSCGMTSALRFFFKLLREVRHRKNIEHKDINILIVGAGFAGVRLLKEILRNPGMGKVVGFIDDNRKKVYETIHGIKVLGIREDIPRIVKEENVNEIVLAIPSAEGETVRDILRFCEQSKAKIRIVPSWDKIISGQMEVKPRDVLPEDLLGRETVKINTDEVSQYLKDRVVLVTGAGGSIGSEICRQVASFGVKELILFDHHENFVYFLAVEFKSKYPNLRVRTVIGDIRDVGLLKHVFSKSRPQVVFHAAAHKHVPLMEDSPSAAVKNNIFGTRNIIYACQHYRVEKLVQISTDKAVNPINNMGMSKRVAEMILQARAEKRSHTKFMAVRFGNVLGSAGSVVPLFKKQIKYGGPITVTHPDVKRYFMSIKEAVMLVLQAGAIGKGGEIFILDMGEQIKVVEIAKNLIALSGLVPDKDIQIKFTGLRPGEKLEEEILLDKEKDAVTKHDKIFVSCDKILFDPKELHLALKKLHRMTELMDEEGIIELMKELVIMSNTSSIPAKQFKDRIKALEASSASKTV